MGSFYPSLMSETESPKTARTSDRYAGLTCLSPQARDPCCIGENIRGSCEQRTFATAAKRKMSGYVCRHSLNSILRIVLLGVTCSVPENWISRCKSIGLIFDRRTIEPTSERVVEMYHLSR